MKLNLSIVMFACASLVPLFVHRISAEPVFFEDFGSPPAPKDAVLSAETGSWSNVTTGGTGGSFSPVADTANLFGRGPGNGVLQIVRGTTSSAGRANLISGSSVGSLSFELHEPETNTQTLFLQLSAVGVAELRFRDGVISGANLTLPGTVPYTVGTRIKVDVLWNFTPAAVTDNGLPVPTRSVAIYIDGVLRQTGTVSTTAGEVSFVAVSAINPGASFLIDELAIDRGYRIAGESMRVRDLAINGGGKVTGVEFHPTVSGLHYIRTDTTGLLRRRAGDTAWFELTGMFTPAYGEELAGVDAIATTAGNADLLLAVFNNNKSNSAGTPNGGIFRSINQGASWQKVLSINSPQGNNDTVDSRNSRDYGPSMIFDPNSPAVIYHGSRKDGLWQSLSGGVAGSWVKIGSSGLPPLTGSIGIRAVAVDPTGPMIGAGTATDPRRSSRVFVSYYQAGVYRSIDGGQNFLKLDTFTNLAGTYAFANGAVTEQRPAYPLQMRVDSAGNLFATHANGVARLAAGSTTWTNFTPAGAAGAFLALAINPLNRLEILAAQSRRIYRTSDGGANWFAITNFNTSGRPDESLTMRFTTKRGWYTFGIGNFIKSLAFDPAADNSVVLTDIYGVWRTANVFAANTLWEDYNAGLENTASLTAATPPAKIGSPSPAAFYSGVADVVGFRHSDTQTVPSRTLNLGRNNITGLDYNERNPAVLVAASMDVEGTPLEFQALFFRSADAGNNWTPMSNPYGTTQVRACKLAVSSAPVEANLANLNVVAIGSNGSRPWRYTLDGGSTWASAAGIPNANLPGAKEYILDQLVAADRVTGGTFYAILPSNTRTEFWRSTDGGANWTKMAAALDLKKTSSAPVIEGNVAVGFLPAALGTVHIEAAPGLAGQVWVSLGRNGLWRSADGGENFERITGFDPIQQIRFSFGKEKPGTSVPSVYAWSSVNGEWGFFRSTDLGLGWDQISDATRPGQQVKFLRGDRQNYGRVFIGDGARGFYFWELVP
jgi:hypothetical protein